MRTGTVLNSKRTVLLITKSLAQTKQYKYIVSKAALDTERKLTVNMFILPLHTLTSRQKF